MNDETIVRPERARGGCAARPTRPVGAPASRRTTPSRALLLVALLLVGLGASATGCGDGVLTTSSPSPSAEPATPSSITGTVHDITRSADGSVTTLYVVDDAAIEGLPDQASVKVTSSTRIWLLKGGRGTAADLDAGQMVSVWFEGEAVGTHPMRATAADVRIRLSD